MHGILAALVLAAAGPRVVQLTVTDDGFVPQTVSVKKGQPLKLVVTRKTEHTCAKEVVIKEAGVSKKLPLGEPVEIAFTPAKAGKLRYACGMDMVSGVLVVE